MHKLAKVLFFVSAMCLFISFHAYAQERSALTESEIAIACEHNFGEYTYDNNATYLSDGTKTKTCLNGCGVTDTVVDEGTKLILGKPGALTASQKQDSVVLKWNEVKDATGYRIYLKSAGKWKKIASTAVNTYRVNDRKPGEKLQFAVKAYTKENGKAVFAPNYTSIKTATKCSAPEAVTVQSYLNEIKLSWSECEGADGYYIYYRKNGSWKKIDSFIKKTCVTYSNLSSGKSYIFAVRPFIKADKLIGGDFSTVHASTLPDAPQIKVDFISKGKVSVSWNTVNGADGYRVYYKTNNNKYKLYNVYKQVKKLTFNLKADNYYTFAVKAYKKVGGKTIYGSYKPLKVHIGNAFDRKVVNPKNEQWNLIIVNHRIEYEKSYTPKLASVPDGYKLDYRVAPYFNDMYKAAAKDGVRLTPVSAYRSYEYQQKLYKDSIYEYVKYNKMSTTEAEKKTATQILPPGTSEHNLGLAVDIGSVDSKFANSNAYKWLRQNAHKYGFIERYTKEKQSITGIIPEAWHWRFVGVEHAEKIKNSGLCLEEYIEKYGLT